MVKLLAVNLPDDASERVRLSHAKAIEELQAAPTIASKIVTCSLADGVVTPVAHELGRVPAFVTASIIRGATATGRIVEVRDGKQNRAKFVTLVATGHGATISVDLLVR